MSRAKRTVPEKKSLLDSFLIEWPDELEVILIDIIQYYIEDRKLTDNTFKAQDHTTITIKLQSSYISLNIGPARNIISRVQINGHIELVYIYSFIIYPIINFISSSKENTNYKPH